ncbi:MAG: DNA polymerase I [Bdellovibrio sp.]|nr:MAG: DNA polymerase I [Bdellovibrio sp.]
MKSLYLVDVSNMFFRAYYAIPHLNTSKGLPTNALYGFLTMTLKLLKKIKPDYIAYCFDLKEPSFRAEIYEDYKANREEMPDDLVPQMPYMRQLTESLGIPVLEKPGYEADDLIGTLVKKGRRAGLEVVIVSGDKDFAQLIEPHVYLYDTMRNIKYDVQGVVEKWGVYPEQMVDYLAIVGDSSDNIPGVKGIGPKGAQKLLAEFKTLDGIYKNLDKIKSESIRRKLIESKDNAYLAKKLVTIVTDVDLGIKIEDLKIRKVDEEKLRSLLEELEFESFLNKLIDKKSSTSHSPKKSQKPSSQSSSDSFFSDLKEVSWSLEEIEKNISYYEEVWFALNERGLCLGYKDLAIYIDPSQELGEVLESKFLYWKGFDIKSVWHALEIKTPEPPLVDEMLSAYVLKAGAIKSLEEVYLQYTRKKLPELTSPKDILEAEEELSSVLENQLEKVNGDKVLEEMELPLVPILYHMERKGICLDTQLLKKQSQKLAKDIRSLEKKIFKEAGQSFNVASTKQLAEVLFVHMGLPPGKKTKTGYSTSSDVLQKLAPLYPICRYVLEFRELTKLKSTYVDALPQLVNPKTGRLHTQFRQALTSTGRLSSFNPNLQNIPIRTERGREVRRAFVAPKGHLLLSVDYSQIELRVLAEITGDEGLCQAFKEEKDIHAATAALIFDVDYEDVTSEQRTSAKAVNYGIAYGQGAYGLSESLGISRKEASEIIENYFHRFPKVKAYMDDIVKVAKKQGYVETLYGRRRYIEELQSKNKNLIKFGERAAINAPIQGTASDIMKKAMIAVFDEVSSPLLLQVHDELIFECPEDKVEKEAKQIKSIMENIVSFKVPLKVNIAWGKNWEDAHA